MYLITQLHLEFMDAAVSDHSIRRATLPTFVLSHPGWTIEHVVAGAVRHKPLDVRVSFIGPVAGSVILKVALDGVAPIALLLGQDQVVQGDDCLLAGTHCPSEGCLQWQYGNGDWNVNCL